MSMLKSHSLYVLTLSGDGKMDIVRQVRRELYALSRVHSASSSTSAARASSRMSSAYLGLRTDALTGKGSLVACWLRSLGLYGPFYE